MIIEAQRMKMGQVTGVPVRRNFIDLANREAFAAAIGQAVIDAIAIDTADGAANAHYRVRFYEGMEAANEHA